MSGPDRIWAAEGVGIYGGNVWYAHDDLGGTEYIRRDPAVLASLPEVQALIAGALQSIADKAKTELSAAWAADLIAQWVRNATPSDAIAARDAMIAEAEKAERDRIIAALRAEADVLPCSEDAKVTEGCADLIEAAFSYDEADRIAAIRKCWEIPASNKGTGEQ